MPSRERTLTKSEHDLKAGTAERRGWPHELPRIIQGGMGAGVSSWRLARAVARAGQLGVVSGTALDLMMARRLQRGDPGGDLRRALAAFPGQDVAARILARWFVPGGKDPATRFATAPMLGEQPSREAEELLIAANFCEVHLAKQGHAGAIGINYLHKIQPPLPASLWGALLAGVDVVIVGAGIPLQIPGMLDALVRDEPVEFVLDVTARPGGGRQEAGDGARRETGSAARRETDRHAPHSVSFDPRGFLGQPRPRLRRPRFLPIVSSAALGALMLRKCAGGVDGLVVEGSSAGGHNAPPRGRPARTPQGEPAYGPRDAVDPSAFASLGVPFWLAGSCGSARSLAGARAAGAAGVQVGTVFAFCAESDLRDDLKRDVVARCRAGEDPPRPFTDPVASPTGFPFKVLPVEGTLSDADVYASRRRRCDLGYLREAYEREDGSLGWRCPAEDPRAYVRKGGKIEDTVGRKCLCNALAANVGLQQQRRDDEERPLVTTGDDLSGVTRLVAARGPSYTAGDVIEDLLGGA